ncbi:carbohydrate ABC transporter permease [Trichococcus shcherbakoviae]|uniref:Sugar ABC transporter permease n=1 Tax=Trichococcus shcherbakoviae subsp. psychrophilus TaxID=2585775 RepID=A0A5C5ECV5_9LACT|nr:sugar ABC transporter permease [Trichococcus shcherbakoviae]OUL10131.1 sugar ABC transporter permease [Sedimentibacter sp. SX930]TNV70015.1 sugar ABC transporter permease [Trichococcus shcherbakoviae subsp. psychrophilus]
MKKSFNKVYLAIMIPALIIFFVLHTYPLLQGVFYSFTDWKGYGNFEFVGLKNYFNVFKDDRVGHAYLFTIGFAIISTVITNIISLALAIGLNSKISFKRSLRGIYFLPYILGTLVIGYIFNFIFSYFLPAIGKNLGIALLANNILGNPDLAWIGIVIVAVWQSTAFNTILYLSGLVTIDPDLYEAADIDGATSWIKFKEITFPLIAPFFIINVVVSMKNYLMVFDQIVALTGGGPGTSTESISLLIYKGGFSGGEFAYQSANAVIFFIIVVAISLFQIKILEKRNA